MALERKLFGLLAHPAGHSLSPVMHNKAFAELGLPYYYHPFDVRPEDLPQAVSALKIMGIKGVNVTIPHKERIIPLLDELDPEAEAIGAVNTVILTSDGRLIGYNTDGAGYVQSLQKETKIDLTKSRVLLLGAGGAAKAIGVYLLKEGAAELVIANRTGEKAEKLAGHLDRYMKSKQLGQASVSVMDWSQLRGSKALDFQLVINTTSVGMWPHVDQMPVELKGLCTSAVVSDIVYNPYETLFLKQAKGQGAQIHHGLGMLVYQGALAFKLFTGYEAPVNIMEEAVRQFMKQKESQGALK
jgi:shikimate dehydrogenase